MPASLAPQAPVYQVSELVELLRGLVESALPRLWVQGEVSNFSRPASGHWYFTLKDARAQLRCVMFKSANFHVRPMPRDGDAVLVRGELGVYAARGELQLVCEHLEPAGEGALLRAFEQLKARLAAEGLFDARLKRPVPAVPRAVGIVSSATGAAIQDMLSTLARRFPLVRVYVYPVPVQGAEAAPAIVRALRELPQRAEVDVILLGRGGGSLEDLWAFNEEAVARAIRACTVPVVTGIGHEVDFTIADLAADLRAPTPTAAAELVSPDRADLGARLQALATALAEALDDELLRRDEQLQRAEQRLQLLHPGRRLRDAAQRLDEQVLRLEQAQRTLRARCSLHAAHLRQRLLAAAPANRLLALRRQLEAARLQLQSRLDGSVQASQGRLLRAEALLQSLNPRAVLGRGFAIVLDAQGHALTAASEAQTGDALKLLLSQGSLGARVTDVDKGN